MTPSKPSEPPKSWKKINEERKALKKQRKQAKLLKDLEKSEDKLEESPVGLPAKPKPSTVSIAVPGSILENAQSAELRTYVAGQIARAACIFRVSEIVVFDDVGLATARETKRSYEVDANADGDDTGDAQATRTVRSSSLQLARILQYLECPQYLRKFFFPLHKDLQYSGLLNPLDAPHHLRQQNVFRYREGIIVDKTAKAGHSYANVGLLQDVLLDRAIEHGVRVTVKLQHVNGEIATKKVRGTVVSPDEPRAETGVYWGYTVRIAHAIADLFTKSPYAGGYDLTIGTSDRGNSVHEVAQKSLTFNHVLIVFGGLKGLETALANDDQLTVDDPALLFDRYINVLPKQGSRTIRTEEALLIALAALQEKFQPQVADVDDESQREMLAQSDETGVSQPEYKQREKKRIKSTVEQATSTKSSFEAKTKRQEKVERNEDTSEDQSAYKQREKKRKAEVEQISPIRNPFDTKTKKPKAHIQKQQIDDDAESFEVVAAAAHFEAKSAPNDLGDLSRFD